MGMCLVREGVSFGVDTSVALAAFQAGQTASVVSVFDIASVTALACFKFR